MRVRRGEGFWQGCGLCLAAAAVVLFSSLIPQAAHAETRSLKLYFIHTKERAEIVYKRNGRYVQSGLNEINRFLRDWRRDEPAKMDPRLLDLVWTVYRSVAARDYIHVVSAYRSPATNKMLRSRSSGVAQKSQHTLGKAMDFYIPGVPLSKLRSAAFKAEGGGVGYYPKSGAPFVHLDVGNVRSWPRMRRGELIALFPDGKTIHLPADGKPLPGYQQALAAYKSRQRSGGDIAIASAADTSGGGARRGLFAALLGGGPDEDQDAREAIAVAAAARPAPAARGSVEEPVRAPQASIVSLPKRAVPLPTPRPAYRTAALPTENLPLPSPAPVRMASAGGDALTSSLMAGIAHDEKNAQPSATLAASDPVLIGRSDAFAFAAMDRQEEATIARDPSGAKDKVKTTGKRRKPTSADARPDSNSRQVPISRAIAHWALSNKPVIANAADIREPFFAHVIVRVAPRMVYTAGFQTDGRELDASRFSGKAVEFLSVVRFASN